MNFEGKIAHVFDPLEHKFLGQVFADFQIVLVVLSLNSRVHLGPFIIVLEVIESTRSLFGVAAGNFN